MTLEDLKVYQLAMDLGERVWTEVATWDIFARDTVGKQLVRSADSIAANLSEGFGRFHFKENRQFCYFSRGSLFETRSWLAKASKRGLISKESFSAFERDIEVIGKMLNAYIKAIGAGPGPQMVKETGPEWLTNDQSPEFMNLNDSATRPLTNDQCLMTNDAAIAARDAANAANDQWLMTNDYSHMNLEFCP